MNKIEKLQAELALAEAEEKYLVAKAEFRDDPDKKKAFKKAQAVLLAARDNFRDNYREAPSGPGDGTANPAAVSALLEVK